MPGMPGAGGGGGMMSGTFCGLYLPLQISGGRIVKYRAIDVGWG